MVDLLTSNEATPHSHKRHVDDILAEDQEELQDMGEENQNAEGEQARDPGDTEIQRARALVQKIHVNTGHASAQQLKRLALRCKASPAVMQAINEFKCSICDELRAPPTMRKSTIPHAESPNQIVGVDYVQVDLKREDESGKIKELKIHVLTVVDLATDFCQQIVVEPGRHAMAKAFHQVWSRPFGVPKMVFMDPDRRNISYDFQRYLVRNDIALLHAAAESHWQAGKVESCNRVLRSMAQKVWRNHSDASPTEVIELCATMRNEQLRKHGFSPVQWFLGREPRHAGSLADVDEQNNPVTQSQIMQDPSFYEHMKRRDTAAQSFIEEHAKDAWRRAVAGRNRPMRGPYAQGQLVYMFRRQGKGMLQTRHGSWIGPGKIIGMESSTNSVTPRLVWVSYNGFLYRCSPEGLRPLPQDEEAFRSLSKQLALGQLSPDMQRAEDGLKAKHGQYVDLVPDVPMEEDTELDEDMKEEPEPPEDNLEGPKPIRRRFYRSEEFWRKRAAGMSPAGALQEGDRPVVIQESAVPSIDESTPPSPSESVLEPDEKRRRVEINSDAEELEYTPSLGESPQHEPAEESPEADMPSVDLPAPNDLEAEQPMEDSGAEPVPQPVDAPVPNEEDDELMVTRTKTPRQETVLEVSLDIMPEDITNNPLCLWNVLDECMMTTPKAKQRKVEVSFRKLSPSDKALFEKAMQKEWNSWVENKVTSICKSKGVSPDRIIKARWVLVWKKSSDPDDRSRTPKARLVLVGWQDPELGKIQTDSPTLRKETKHLILTICSSKLWKLWGADIKTAFLSGDPSQREIYFRPPKEIKEWMKLGEEDLLRLEKAAYGLAEAPRAWFLRLSRELAAAGLEMSRLDPCLYCLRRDGKLLGICGVHVDDLIGGGTQEMDEVLHRLRKKVALW